MAVSTTLGNGLLDKLVAGGSYSFSTPYLGLVFEGSKYPEYQHVPLNAKGIEGKNLMAAAVTNSVKNQEIIYFAENETGSTCKATGWGIFNAPTGTSPSVSGTFAEAVSIPVNSVPMFRIDKFKLTIE